MQAKKFTRVEDINLASVELLNGKTLIIMDGISTFLSADTTEWNARSVESPSRAVCN
ncbi:spore germination protein [Neobacillus vireti]|uniref:spore germination protein n=1 Tax=Bacillaceae TaxID=186817 RepID=UPI003B586F23